MRKLTATHSFECDVDTFWKTFFDPEYNKALYLDELKFKAFEILEQTETKRRMRAVPKLNMPGPVMKVLGDSFGYEENGSFDKTKSTFSWKMIPNTMADRLFTEGTVKIEADGDKRVKRLSDAKIEAKIFGLGGVLEGSTEKEVREAWDKEAAFMSKWLKEKR